MSGNEKKDRRAVSLERAEVLKKRISNYLEAKKKIPNGMDLAEEFARNKERILQVLGGSQQEWDDWRWQLRNRIRDVETLGKILNLTPEVREAVEQVGKVYRWALSPYYASLMDIDEPLGPIRLMGVPTRHEISRKKGQLDPMSEEYTNPAGAITRRYPDRLIIYVTNECAMYCRHCQRRRNIGEKDVPRPMEEIEESIAYIRQNPEIRDVLITGGDPLTLPTPHLEKIVRALRKIEHVEIIRIGSRTLVTMPQRIDEELVDMLQKYHPLYINTHTNHPKEITFEMKQACERLANAGIPLGNQAVLLNGINNDRFVMKKLNQDLLKVRVRPYYIFHAKHVRGTTHFNTSVDDGLEIMEYLRGYTSGLAIPTFIVNAPGGYGKTPLLPQYLVSRGKGYITIRTWEGRMIRYEDHETKPLEI
ncbi:MAG TPA: glutamate 2,3-aminomutase [Thermotogota bacterium]|nr:glutamate 2,3-aminomutase [Thermotogota bacterium]